MSSFAPSDDVESSPQTRRAFLGKLGRAAAATTAVTGLSVAPALIGLPGAEAEADDLIDKGDAKQRRAEAANLRCKIAKLNKKVGVGAVENNGDEDLYSSRIGNFSKGLPHDANGVVDPAAYAKLLKALKSGKPEHFEAIPMGCPNPSMQMKLVNPQSGLAFDLEGLDVCQFGIAKAPALASAEAAGEMVELYWAARLRDVNFDDYPSSGLAQAAATELTGLSDFRGPKSTGTVTPDLLFRDDLPGALTGPYVSQFLLLPVPFGAVRIEQKMRTLMAGTDHMTAVVDWLAVQNGCRPTAAAVFDSTHRYIRNGRDLSQWVHIDVLYQAYFHAALMMLTPPDATDLVTGGGLGVPLDAGNPYARSVTQEGFGTFGGPYVMTILTEVATRALKAVWFQKWFVHRRLRPEAYGGLVHQVAVDGALHPLHADVLGSQVLADLILANGTGLHPQAFPEGSPMHPSYGAGHATVAGACVTILKALFDESFVIANPKVVTPDGTGLVDYVGPPLTVGGELNKLAMNVATGRNLAGVHWRTDALESLRLGERVAIEILEDQRKTFNESFDGFELTTFDGESIVV